MVSFLNLQLLRFLSQPTSTIFAPIDEVMIDFSGRFPDYQPLFNRHALFTGTIVAVEAISQRKDSKWLTLKTQHVQL
ncbi:hypothetical protein L1987_79924 [Smallanthus sonchifolius]|uniref:Uncharacterized protein n=1 Tax=Smallanthus sonchifolius TaxID=185202 RepID=A0ACB8YMG6_9ASTR|nr:hypothetical protein L1987_79924 [Smallanthus sonchifolius]